MEMGNEFCGSDYLWFLGRHQVLEVCIARDKEVTFIRAAEDQNGIRVRQAVPQRSYSRQQSFSLGEIHREDTQMISNLFEFRPTSVSGQKEFLKHNRVNGQANLAICFGGKQLRRRWIATKVFDDHVRVHKHEWLLCFGTIILLEQFRFSHLSHALII